MDNMGKLLVMVFAAPCSHDKSCQNLHPDPSLRSGQARTSPQNKSCNVTDFWLRLKLYRDIALVPLTNILYLDSIPASIKLIPPTCGAGRGVTAFWLKYQDRDRMLRRVTQPPHITGTLAVTFYS